MIIVMQEGSSEDQIRNVNDHLVAMGFGVHRSNSDSQVLLGAIGAVTDFDPRNIELIEGVCEVAHHPAVQAGEPRVPPGWHYNRARQRRAHWWGWVSSGSRTLRGGIFGPDRGDRRAGCAVRCEASARGRIQASYLTVFIPGAWRKGPEAAAHRGR